MYICSRSAILVLDENLACSAAEMIKPKCFWKKQISHSDFFFFFDLT